MDAKLKDFNAVDWDRKPSEYRGKGHVAKYPAPESGFKSAMCRKEEHSNCFSLKCACECHKRLIKSTR